MIELSEHIGEEVVVVRKGGGEETGTLTAVREDSIEIDRVVDIVAADIDDVVIRRGLTPPSGG